MQRIHPAARAISVAQLQDTLQHLHSESDKEAAREISFLKLTERLSDPQRNRLSADLPGPVSKEAFKILAESSAFNDLPPAEILTNPPPAREAQTALLAQTRDYIVKTLQQLPNFFATRETVNYQGSPEDTPGQPVHTKFEPLHAVSHSSVTVLYRDHREMIARAKKGEASGKQLKTMGEFGGILETIFGDAAKGHIYWSHWEQGTSAPVAVFRYEVPEPQSHYTVGTVNVEHGAQHNPGYHGEITLNPDNGSILRVTIIAEMKLDDPVSTADLAVDYGPVEIGGRIYICPLTSVATSEVRMVMQQLNFSTGAVEKTSLGVPKSYLNEVEFRNYHLFRAETRILDGYHDPSDKESRSKSQ